MCARAKIVDKSVYSPWTNGALDRLLQDSGVRRLIITGGKSDVCVMAAVLGAIDRGYQILLPTDSLCSGVDETNDAAMMIYRMRFSMQVSLVALRVVWAVAQVRAAPWAEARAALDSAKLAQSRRRGATPAFCLRPCVYNSGGKR